FRRSALVRAQLSLTHRLVVLSRPTQTPPTKCAKECVRYRLCRDALGTQPVIKRIFDDRALGYAVFSGQTVERRKLPTLQRYGEAAALNLSRL
ncbi:MAG: hypothetical protein V2I43_05620, partial [Parvularcula sp.]|nr:hypothetical protein [Parvularcula sp.]